MKAIIVEDSRLARQELKTLLKDFPKIELIGEAVNAEEAQQKIEHLNPDLLFLDIQLPGRNGFELLERLDEVPQVIFTTAFDQYAIKSFEYNTIDYLMKPIRKERLKLALEKLPEPLPPPPSATPDHHFLNEDSRIFVKDGEKCWFVYLHEIRRIESVGNYARLYFQNNKPLLHKSLNAIEQRLDPNTFFRINRSEIINIQYIDHLGDWFNGKLKVFLKTGEEVEISRRQSNRFKDLFKL